jgi:branched-chain amino acid transport system substrate-binding protein
MTGTSSGIPLRYSAVVLVLAALTLLTGCGGGDSTGKETAGGLPEEIVIGAAIGKTGYLAPYDGNIAAIKQLVAETNAQGGIDGHKLRVIEVDNRSDPQQAPRAAQEVIERGADALLYSCETPIAAAGAAVAEENNLINFTLCASEPGYGPPFMSRLSFSANRSLISEASARASFLPEKDFERPFLFRDTSITMGKVDCFGFQGAWEHLGGEIAGEADFKNSDPSIASQISELKASDADSINVCSYPPGGAAAIKQIRAAGVELPIAAPSAFDGVFWLKGVPDTMDFYATLNGSAYDPTDAKTAKLFARLERAGIDTDVSGNLLASYAAGQLILDAIKETHSVEGDVLADALEAKPHDTAMGEIAYTPESHIPVGHWWIYEFPERQPKLLTKVSPQFFPEYGG